MTKRFFAVALFTFATSVSAQLPDERVGEAAPDTFKVRFEASTGPFEVMVYRAWSPAAADRMYHLVRLGYYDGASIFRVVPGFVAQFGIPENPAAYAAWRQMPVADEPVRVSNLRGRVSFARGGPETRTGQLFINLRDNVRLDSLVGSGIVGYPPVGEVVSGMAAIDSLNGQYGNAPSGEQQQIARGGRTWLDANFPGLDWLKSVTLMEDATLEAALARQANRFSAGFVAGDVDAMMDIYTEDAVLLPGASEPITGVENVRAYWTLPPNRTVTHHQLTSERIEVSGRLASDYGFYEVSGTTDGEAWGPSYGRYLVVWRRGDDGRWRMAQDMWASRVSD